MQFSKTNVSLTNHNRSVDYSTNAKMARYTACSGTSPSLTRCRPTLKSLTLESSARGRDSSAQINNFSRFYAIINNTTFDSCVSSTINQLSDRTFPRWNLCSIVLLFLLLSSCGAVIPVLTIDASFICNRIPGLVPRQRIICKSHPDAMAAVGEGGTLALQECRHQFRSSRWNCYGPEGGSDDEEKSGQPLLNVAPFGSRESAFAYAIRSAGITHAITTACSRGLMQSCGCDRDKQHAAAASVSGYAQLNSDYSSDGQSWNPKTKQTTTPEDTEDDWKWGGCSANVNYGLRLSRSFVDARESINEDSQSLVNLHNNRVGRKALRDSVGLGCKCHGVSGSCTAKTCWTTLPEFRSIGDHLALVYGRAKQVEPIRGERAMKPILLKLKRSTSMRSSQSQKAAAAAAVSKKPPLRELVYLTKSPDYCEPDLRSGTLGTRGRSCNHTSSGGDGCEQLCCGRGFDARIQLQATRCNCKFHWCCHVTCDECTVALYQCACR